jgi:DNA polymerase-3 subunit epsilon
MIITQPLAFVDIETTGFDPNKQEIIELGVVIAKMNGDKLEIVDQLDLKIAPKHIENAEAGALRVNGYNEADWLFAIDLETAMKTFVKKTEGAIFVAHNVTFDYGFIDANLKRLGIENKLHFYILDTVSVAFSILRQNDDMGKISLRALCEKYGVENKKAHSAYADALATYEVFKKLLNLK